MTLRSQVRVTLSLVVATLVGIPLAYFALLHIPNSLGDMALIISPLLFLAALSLIVATIVTSVMLAVRLAGEKRSRERRSPLLP